MRRKALGVLPVLIGLSLAAGVQAQTLKTSSPRPSNDVMAAAYKMAEQVFADISHGENEKVSKWLVAQLGDAWDAQTKVKNTNDFKSKLDMIALSPPGGTYGKMDGFDLLKESILPGTNRYFRLTYMTYHEGAPLLWEFRFYVKPDGKPKLTYVSWNDKNPFEYLTSPEMLIDQWYSSPKF